MSNQLLAQWDCKRISTMPAPREIDAAFASFVGRRPDAVFVASDPLFTSRRVQLANSAARHGLPMIASTHEIVEAGGLISYGSNVVDARPGGNLTGVTSLLESLGAKQLGLLRELVPSAITIAMLVNPNDTWAQAQIAHTQSAARELGQ